MAKILQYGATSPPKAKIKENGFFKYVSEENGGVFFCFFFLILWYGEFFPKIPKLVKLALEKTQKKIPIVWVQKTTKFVGKNKKQQQDWKKVKKIN